MSQYPKELRHYQALICHDIEAICRGIEVKKKGKTIGMPRHHCSHVATSSEILDFFPHLASMSRRHCSHVTASWPRFHK